MFGSQIHALPDQTSKISKKTKQKKYKIESTIFKFSIASLGALTASESLVKSGDHIQQGMSWLMTGQQKVS